MKDLYRIIDDNNHAIKKESDEEGQEAHGKTCAQGLKERMRVLLDY